MFNNIFILQILPVVFIHIFALHPAPTLDRDFPLVKNLINFLIKFQIGSLLFLQNLQHSIILEFEGKF